MTPADPDTYEPCRSLQARIARRLVQWTPAAPLPRSPDRPIISFTFDDFPKSAAIEGAGILEKAGARATFYAASGLAGRRLRMGDMFDADDVQRLENAGHEIASHTRSHDDCRRAALDDTLADIAAGDDELLDMGLHRPSRQFAYPFGETSVALKRALATRYDCARGILPGINRKGSDRAQLRAIELGNDLSRIARAFDAIRSAAYNPGWVIFFTHDVRPNPSAYGVSPDVLREIVDAARSAQADILNVRDAWANISGAAA